MADDQESSSNSSILKWIAFIVLFVGAFLVVKFVWGVAMAILKWFIIGAIALVVVWLVLRKGGKSSDAG